MAVNTKPGPRGGATVTITSPTEDIAIRLCKQRIAEAVVALRRAREALDGIENHQIRLDLEYQILNIGSD